MKKVLLTVAIAANLFVAPVWAADLWWDTNGTTAGSSGGTTASGAWTTANFFNSDSTGGGAGALSTWAGTDTAHFSAGTNATGTSTISGNATVTGLVIEEGKVIFSGTVTANA